MCCLEPFLKMSPVFLLLLGLAQACIPREGLMSRLSPDAADPPSHPHRPPSHDGSLCAPEPPVDGSAPHQQQHVLIHTQNAYCGAKLNLTQPLPGTPGGTPVEEQHPLSTPQRAGTSQGLSSESAGTSPASSFYFETGPRSLRLLSNLRASSTLQVVGFQAAPHAWLTTHFLTAPRICLGMGGHSCRQAAAVKPVLVTSLPQKLSVKRTHWNLFRCAYMMVTFLFVSYNRGDWCYCHYCNPEVDNRNDPCCAF
uniref:epididymal protein 13 n=1 Tax=Ictidomys tridecemlineatus TaxID=43179 RepID=UPI001AA003AF|nr:epididymal protein 13 [Ictidomys tridecemlineatus]